MDLQPETLGGVGLGPRCPADISIYINDTDRGRRQRCERLRNHSVSLKFLFCNRSFVGSIAVLAACRPIPSGTHREKAQPMRTATRSFRGVLRDKRGLETLEYAAFAVLFVVIIGGCVAALGPGVNTTYETLGNWVVTQAAAI